MPDVHKLHDEMKQHARHHIDHRHRRVPMEHPIILEISTYGAEDDDAKNIHVLDKPVGIMSFDYRFEGKVSICLNDRTHSASFVSLKITESAVDSADVGESDNHSGLKKEIDKSDAVQKKANVHMTDMEKHLTGMVGETKMLLTMADLIKNEEATFHQQSLDMNSASKWWPIIHLSVLLVTGFTQVNHMINFFKHRHII